MKLTELPIWPRILAAKPQSSKATRPSNVLRAVLRDAATLKSSDWLGRRSWFVIEGELDTTAPAPGHFCWFGENAGGRNNSKPFVWSNPPTGTSVRAHYRSLRWTGEDREQRRAAHDKKFARVLHRRAAAQKQVRDLTMHIAGRYHATVRPLFTSKYAGIVWSAAAAENVEWDRYAKSYKFPCKYSDAGAFADASGILLSPTRGNQIHLPLPPKSLIRAAVLTEPHPVGFFAVPVKGQPGVFACLGTSRDYYGQVRMADAKNKWNVIGFSVRGRLVPECVARGAVTLADISAEQNAEARQIMIERFGLQRFLSESGATELDHSDVGTLYEISGLKIVKVVNSTPEPDGTYKDYFLRVPPGIKTSQEAVAWTFGMKPEEYQPAAQS